MYHHYRFIFNLTAVTFTIQSVLLKIFLYFALSFSLVKKEHFSISSERVTSGSMDIKVPRALSWCFLGNNINLYLISDG